MAVMLLTTASVALEEAAEFIRPFQRQHKSRALALRDHVEQLRRAVATAGHGKDENTSG